MLTLKLKGDKMNTAIGYKLFRIKKTCPGELFPLYVNADHSIPIGEWLIAVCGQRTDNGKVKSKLGPLKFRPGFHINDTAPYVSICFTYWQKRKWENMLYERRYCMG